MALHRITGEDPTQTALDSIAALKPEADALAASSATRTTNLDRAHAAAATRIANTGQQASRVVGAPRAPKSEPAPSRYIKDDYYGSVFRSRAKPVARSGPHVPHISPAEADQIVNPAAEDPQRLKNFDGWRFRPQGIIADIATYSRATAEDITNHAAGEQRTLRADEQREVDALQYTASTLTAYLDANRASFEEDKQMMAAIFAGQGPRETENDDNYSQGRPLDRGQSFAGYTRANARGEELHDQLNLGRYLRGVTMGNWRGSDRELEAFNSMSGAGLTTGGALLPKTLAAEIIDLAGVKTRVMEAGARVVPMATREVDVPKWTQDPSLAWRDENAVIGESDAAVNKVTLSAKSLATVVRVSRELVEDTNIGDALANSFAAALAAKVDQAALYGTGANGQPTGVKVHSAVAKTAMGSGNGAALASWDPLIDAVGRLRDANEEPNAQVLADRTARTLAKLRTVAGGEYLAPPAYIENVTRLTTTGIPVNLTVGTSSDCSDVFTADWSQLYIGIHVNLVIEVLRERYMTTDGAETPAGGQYGFLAWFRGDIQVARAGAFDVLTGVRA